MEVICPNTAAFYALIDAVVDRMKEADQAHKILNVRRYLSSFLYN